MIELTSLRHAYPEPKGFEIIRPSGLKVYTFLHFFNSVKLLCNGETITTQPGAVIVFDVDTPQFFKAEQPLVHNWMHMTGEVWEYMEKYGLNLDTLYYPENADFITAIVRELEQEFYGSKDNKSKLLEIKFEELLIKLARSVNGQGIPNFSSHSKKQFRALRSEMFSDLSRHWTTEEMAKTVGFSESRFYRIYKYLYGISPTNDLINARIEKGKNMLSYEEKSVSEIAETLGYDNTTHFIRQFKSKTGVSPTEYKKMK